MMTLVGICPLNKTSMSAVLAPATRVKCLATTWASGYLAPEAVRTFSRCSCSEGVTLTLGTSRMASSMRTWDSGLAQSSWGGMQVGCMTAPTAHSCCLAWVALATACAAGPWSKKGGCWWSSSTGRWDQCFPEHRTFHLRPSASFPGTLTRSPWHCIHSRAASSGRPCSGRCIHLWPLGHRSSPSPLVWRESGTAGSRVPQKHLHHEKHRFSRYRWMSHWP